MARLLNDHRTKPVFAVVVNCAKDGVVEQIVDYEPKGASTLCSKCRQFAQVVTIRFEEGGY